MNVVKRFASSSTATASSLSQFVPVSAPYLPPVLERHVQRHLSISPESTSIPNPFAGPTRSISRRREKQLRSSLYHDILPLPPTTASASTSDTAGAGKVKILFDGGEKELDWAPAALSFKQQQKATAIQQQGADVKYATGIHKGKTELKFKGHKHEREKPERERETRERLEGMDKRIGEWRKVCTSLDVA
jgi:hypothetical protein